MAKDNSKGLKLCMEVGMLAKKIKTNLCEIDEYNKANNRLLAQINSIILAETDDPVDFKPITIADIESIKD